MSKKITEQELHSSVTDQLDKIGAHESDLVRHGVYGVATGVNALTMNAALDASIKGYVEGMLVAFKNTTASISSVSLNINGFGAKPMLKANGSAVTNLKEGAIYHVRYDGLNFCLLGEGGEYGTATASEVLTGYTVGTEAGLVNGALSLTGNAVASNVLSGKTFYNSDAKTKVTGTMTDRGAVSQTLSINGSYTIPAGYHNGSGKVTQSVTTRAAATITPGTTNQTIAAGQYLSGTQTILGDPDLIASNIKSGVNIFGVMGSLAGNMASGSGYTGSGTSDLTVSGLGFTPTLIAWKAWQADNYNNGYYLTRYYLGLAVNKTKFGIADTFKYNSSLIYTDWDSGYHRSATFTSNGFTVGAGNVSNVQHYVEWIAFG